MSAHHTLLEQQPHARLQFCVTVPVKNEEQTIRQTLRALYRQRSLAGNRFDHARYEVILLINNTSDRSRAIAESFQHQHPAFALHICELDFPPEQAHIGHVRRVVMDEACRRLRQSKSFSSCSAILTTDADTQVASNWLACNVQELSRGADAVGGRILMRKRESTSLNQATQAMQIADDRYRRLVAWLEDFCDPQTHDPWPRHHQHFAGSLAIRAEVYDAIGGMPDVPALEDMAFFEILRRNDMRFRHSPLVRVFTSARLAGRTNIGLASQLNEWKQAVEAQSEVLVDSLAYLRAYFSARRLLRNLWLHSQTGQVVDMMHLTGLPPNLSRNGLTLLEVLSEHLPFGETLDRLDFDRAFREAWPEKDRLGPITDELRDLRQHYAKHQRHWSHAAPTHRSDTFLPLHWHASATQAAQ